MRKWVSVFMVASSLLGQQCKKSEAGSTSGDGTGATAGNSYQTSAEIGAAGGTISDPKGNWSLTIPAGALSSTKTITITTNATATGTVSNTYTAKTPVLRFEPSGLTFLTPATLTITYEQGTMPEGKLEEKLLKYYYVKDDSSVSQTSATVNMTTNQITAQIPHFSFTVGLTISIALVNIGIISNPVTVQNIANSVIAHLQSLPNDAARNQEFADNQALLTNFINKLVDILGADMVTSAFPNADFDGDGFPNSSDPLVGGPPPIVTLVSSGSLFVSTNAGAINSTQFTWRSNTSGTFEIRRNGTNCTDGTLVQSGAVTANSDNTHTPINASALNAGANSFRICTTAASLTGSLLVTIQRDESLPVSSASPAGGTYATAQNVGMSCLDSGAAQCAQIAYTTNGTDPTFDAVGNVTNGTLVTGVWMVPPGSTTLKVRSRDAAGNAGGTQTYSFVGAPWAPPTTSANPEGGAFTTSQVVTLSCADIYGTGCKRIVYTTNGTEPKFSPINGTVINGASTTINIGAGETTLRFRSENNAGFIEPYRELFYSISSSGFTYVGTQGGFARGIGSNPVQFISTHTVNWCQRFYREPTTGIMYCGTLSDSLFLSTDNGTTWTRRSVAQGINSNTITGITGADGKIFVTTLNGLAISSDLGATFVNRTTGDGLGSNSMRAVFADGSKIYVGTDGGLSISSDGGLTFVNRTTANGLGWDVVQSVYANGTNVYAAAGGVSVSTDGGATFVNKTSTNGLPNTNVQFVYVSGSKLYASSNPSTWLRVSSDNGNTFTALPGFTGSSVNGVRVDGSRLYVMADNLLWISTDDGLTFTTRGVAQGVGGSVSAMDINGSTVYLATAVGLSVSNDGAQTFSNLAASNGLVGSGVSKIFASGTKVYGANTGLAISDDGGTHFYRRTTAHGLGHNVIYGIYVSGSNIYVATHGGVSISTDAGATFTNKTTVNGLGDNVIYGIYASGSNIYAAELNSGLAISTDNGVSFINRTSAHGLGQDSGRAVYGSGSNIYVASAGVSVSTNGGTSFDNKTTADGLGSNGVNAIFALGSNVYAGTSGGLSISTNNGSTYVNKTTADGLGDSNVNSVHVSGSNVYVGTNGGLSISTNSGVSFSNKTTVNGLGHNNINSVFYTP